MAAPVIFWLKSCLIFCSYSYVIAGEYVPIDVELPPDVNKVFTVEEIAKYDGSDPDKPLYMAVKGVVFDVSKGADFYGKGKAYNALTGKDCTRAVAKMSLESEDLTHDISDLSESYLKSLDEIYKGTYLPKYPIVGIMDYLSKENAIHQHQHENPLTGDQLLHDHHKDDL